MKKKRGFMVSIALGSDSDLPVLKEAMAVLKEFDVPYEAVLTSAHRSPERTTSYAEGAAGRGVGLSSQGRGRGASCRRNRFPDHHTRHRRTDRLDVAGGTRRPPLDRPDAGGRTGGLDGGGEGGGKERGPYGSQDPRPRRRRCGKNWRLTPKRWPGTSKKTGKDRLSILIRTDPSNPDENALLKAVAVLKEGGVVAYPTETFYGLGADANHEKAVERVYALKGREFNKPLPLIIGDRKIVSRLVEEIPETARKLMDAFWPGALRSSSRPRRSSVRD